MELLFGGAKRAHAVHCVVDFISVSGSPGRLYSAANVHPGFA